jgi:PIN domain nuclease of toxin-antitoxin system
MRLLLDTHILLWFLTNDKKLSSKARLAIEDLGNERWLSPISLLEIALKSRLGKLPLPAPFGVLFPADLLAEDIHLLPLESRHIGPITTLPFHHSGSLRPPDCIDGAGRWINARVCRSRVRCLRYHTVVLTVEMWRRRSLIRITAS